MLYHPDAEVAARLVNADLDGVEAVRALLTERAVRAGLPGAEGERDVEQLRAFVADLRPVFEAAAAGDVRATVGRLNDLLTARQVVARLAAQESPEGRPGWRLCGSTGGATEAGRLVAEALMALAALVCELGPDRLGVCRAPGCAGVFVDTSPNRSRRYCSDRCSSRTNVAAYRARRRQAPSSRATAQVVTGE